jgi:hypothetical protein
VGNERELLALMLLALYIAYRQWQFTSGPLHGGISQATILTPIRPLHGGVSPYSIRKIPVDMFPSSYEMISKEFLFYLF